MTRAVRLLEGLALLAHAGRRSLQLPREIDLLRVQAGALQAAAVRQLDAAQLTDSEFTVFSQAGEDGIIQFLLAHTDPGPRTFIEIGVGSYRESNTRFLVMLDNWQGGIVDAGRRHRSFLAASELAWRHSVDAVSAFVRTDNVNALVRRLGGDGDLGVLSLDIDGNDYWVYEALDSVSPRLVVLEYNATFGAEASVSIPYEPTFSRERAHWSRLYFGASLSAMTHLMNQRGYALVGCNRAGVNAFFVRHDVLGRVPELTAGEAFVPASVRESRSPRGTFSYLAEPAERLALIGHLPVVDVITGAVGSVQSVAG